MPGSHVWQAGNFVCMPSLMSRTVPQWQMEVQQMCQVQQCKAIVATWPGSGVVSSLATGSNLGVATPLATGVCVLGACCVPVSGVAPAAKQLIPDMLDRPEGSQAA